MKKNKLVRGIDNDVWLRFKGYCATNQIRMSDKLTEILNKFIEEEKKRNK